jgi:membrane protease subunit HflK
VRLRFGEVVGDGENRILQKGVHFGWPFPIEEVIKVPNDRRSVDLAEQFMYSMTDEERALPIDQRAERRQLQNLDPAKDGSLITGDVNIAHGEWKVFYRIEDPVNYLENVGSEEAAAELVRVAAEHGIVQTAAQVSADTLLSANDTIRTSLMSRIQDSLDRMDSGIRLLDVSGTAMVPLQVRNARNAVTSASSERAQAVLEAQREHDELLGSAAGAAWEQLWQMVQAYERARLSNDAEALQQAEADLMQAFETLNTGEKYGNMPIGGEVAQAIHQARTYRAQVEEQTRAEADYFKAMLVAYNENPQVFVQRAWTEMLAQLLDSEKDIEVYYAQEKGQIRIHLHRDPQLQRRRDEKRMAEEQERFQKAAEERQRNRGR